MRGAQLFNPRHPAWTWVGAGLLGVSAALSVILVARGPRPLKPRGEVQDPFGDRALGRQGTITEQLGYGRFELSYDTIRGSEENLSLQGVRGRLEEPGTLWMMVSPSATRREGRWLLDGPMDLEARPRVEGQVGGLGRMQGDGPALEWRQGVWTGLTGLIWENPGGQGRGTWRLPAGWRRDLDGRLVVSQGPVVWESGSPGALRRMEALELSASQRFEEAHLREVSATLQGGLVQTARAELDPGWIRWFAPISFAREDGWQGSAERGLAPRPQGDGALQKVELEQVRATRFQGAAREHLEAEGVRWTVAGLRLEGRVAWTQYLDGVPLSLKAPRVLFREAPGEDLPSDLPEGEARAEGHALLAWGARSLSSPQIDVHRERRHWRLAAPVLGRTEEGTFSAGTGAGDPRRWVFEGPIQANLTFGGRLRGDRLVWENETWTLTGHPATWNRLRERLAGNRIVRTGETAQFPEGLSGSLAGAEEDIRLQAGWGELAGREVHLDRGVELRGADWRLQAQRISATLGSGNLVTHVKAEGRVSLKGRMGEGTGEALEMDLKARTATWKGRVRGQGTFTPDRGRAGGTP